jgi:hypothetical protein
MAVCCEHDNDHLGPIESGVFIDVLSGYQFLKKDILLTRINYIS